MANTGEGLAGSNCSSNRTDGMPTAGEIDFAANWRECMDGMAHETVFPFYLCD
jgi:hypothetical protein